MSASYGSRNDGLETVSTAYSLSNLDTISGTPDLFGLAGRVNKSEKRTTWFTGRLSSILTWASEKFSKLLEPAPQVTVAKSLEKEVEQQEEISREENSWSFSKWHSEEELRPTDAPELHFPNFPLQESATKAKAARQQKVPTEQPKVSHTRSQREKSFSFFERFPEERQGSVAKPKQDKPATVPASPSKSSSTIPSEKLTVRLEPKASFSPPNFPKNLSLRNIATVQ